MCSNSEKPITGLAISIAPTEGRLTKGFQSGEKKRTIVRIVVADDHPIVRAALKKLLVLEQGFEVVGEASNGREVLERVRELAPDILLLDLRMSDPDGLATLQTLQQTNQRTRVIVMTASESLPEPKPCGPFRRRLLTLKRSATTRQTEARDQH
jgi:DNA-binding NarL/FixJ family response regulator